MNAKTWIALLSCAGLASFGLGQARKPAAVKPSAPGTSARLVRLDLLSSGSPGAAAVRRDIFVPYSAAGELTFAPPLNGKFQPARGAAPAGSAETPQETGPAIRYLGYIQGKKGTVGLVLFGGQAQAVAAGDVLGSAWKVVKITTEILEVQGSDGKTRTFALEGERT
jgi:hypothetical protein